MTLKSMSINLSNNRNIKKSVSTICRQIRKMNYTRKVLTKIPVSKNSVENKISRYEYCNFLNLIENEDLFFLDESGFNLHLTPKYGYSLKNTKAYTTIPNSKGSNVSFL
ncbi:hypothetical protein DMUE_3704 [Dictyocoela muelleri]|nr:hypothetical protein DMUE_3704 [Dictyocoela muelleri]